MNLAKLSVLTAIIIGATSLVAASPAEMTVFPEESSTRIDSFTSYELEIENVGPVEDTYTLTSSSVEEIDIAPRKLTLGAGEQETLNVWYNPASDRQEGTYSFSITAESRATGDRYSSEIIASVLREHDVSMEIADSKTVCRGETAEYTVAVTNNGIQDEEFALSTDYGQPSQNSVTLEDGETKEVTLTASSESAKTENFNVRAASKTSYAQDIQNIQFNAESCFESSVSVTPQQQRAAGGTTAEFGLTIRNTGTKDDEFTLSSNVGEFQNNDIEVGAGESETTTLDVTRGELGRERVNIQAGGTSSSSTTAQLRTYNGNDMEISFESSTVTACETEEAEVDTVIENTGETDEVFTLQTNRGELQEEVEIEAGESETFTTTVDATQLEPGTYNVKTTATASTYGEPRKSSTAQVTVENCWDVSMNVVPEVASAGENRSVIYEINVENTGTRENTYEIAYEGPEWISIKPEEITVGPGQTGKSYMYAGIPFKKEGNVQITATAVGENATDSQTVELVIGQEIEESIKDGSNQIGGGITGQFSQAFEGIQTSGNLVKGGLAVLIAAIITAVILVREW
jgi:uncharacterized membrane protein